MSFLTALGFLGLLGIVILILIYVLKPNFQQKIVSSTFVWKLSLKYKKKRIPISRFRQIILLICQILIITACSFVLARPYFKINDINLGEEEIYIIDASANMNAVYAGATTDSSTRFERAKQDVLKKAEDTLLERHGLVTVILANETPEVLTNGVDEKIKIERINEDRYDDLVEALNSAQCTYGRCDMDAAILIAAKQVEINPQANVHVYSGTEYSGGGKYEVNGEVLNAVDWVKLTENDTSWASSTLEYNIAVLSCTPTLVENEYVFNVEVASYGKSDNAARTCVLELRIRDADDGNGNLSDYTLQKQVTFEPERQSDSSYQDVQSFTMQATDLSIGGNDAYLFSSFGEVILQFTDLNDSFPEDDSIRVYGGQRDEIRVQYYSARPNSFFYVGFHVLQDIMRNTRDIIFTQVSNEASIALEGYDFYIFEHGIPQVIKSNGLPKDGVVVFCDPDKEINNLLDIEMTELVELDDFTYLEMGEANGLTEYVQADRFGLSSYNRIVDTGDLKTLLTCGGDPVLLASNGEESKVVVMPFDINRSTLSVEWDFMILLYNMVNEYMPLTVTQYLYEIGDTIEVNCKGPTLSVKDQQGQPPIDPLTGFPGTGDYKEFPTKIRLTERGTYTFTTLGSIFQEENEEKRVYVKIATSESNIFAMKTVTEEIVKPNLDDEKGQGVSDDDLTVYYFAAALVALLFVEWWLQSRENY